MQLYNQIGSFLAVFLSTCSFAGDTLLFDDFSCGRTRITGPENYIFRPYPEPGGSTNNPSRLWLASKAAALRQGSRLYFGTPAEFGEREFVRFHSRANYVGNIEVTWNYVSSGFGGSGGFEPVYSWEAVDLWLRHVSPYNLYILQFDRTNQTVVAKRKVPGVGTRFSLSNPGVYYELKTDSENPGGAGNLSAEWKTVGLSEIIHDGKARYNFRASIATIGTNVQIKLWRDGVLVASWTDANDGVYTGELPRRTFAEHLQNHEYDSAKNWDPQWAHPITDGGAIGWRADNNSFSVGDIRVSSPETNSPLRISNFGCNLVLDWNGVALQSSVDLIRWTNVLDAAAPFIFTPSDTTFYRILVNP